MKKQLYYFLLVVALPVIAVMWWWGLFASASIEVAERGEYTYAYVEAIGAYSKLASKQKEVLGLLSQQGIKAGAQTTLLLADPRTTPHEKLEARTGYIIDPGNMPKPPLKVETIPKRQVVVAKIKAHPLFAYGKTYSALLNYAKKHNVPFHLPTLEIVDASVLTVEMPITGESSQRRPQQ